MIISKVLPCKCHRIDNVGKIWTKIIQFSEKGKVGIQTKIGNEWKCLSATTTKRGYRQANIHGKICRVNRLVANNFIPNPLAYMEVHHKNGIRNDDRVDNLEWGDQKMNAADRERDGNTCRGEKNGNSKLRDKDVINILKLRKAGLSLQKIANKFQVSKKLILLISQNKIWKHVK